MTEEKNQHGSGKPAPAINLIGMVSELGLIIALPLVVFVFIGAKLDKHFDTTPAIIICAMLLSAVISTTIISRKVRHLNSFMK